MRSLQYALMALGAGMTLWLASVASMDGARAGSMAPVAGPTPAPLTRVSPLRGAEPTVAHAVPGYPPRPADVPAWYARWSGTAART